jgi:prophage regulatory protein
MVAVTPHTTTTMDRHTPPDRLLRISEVMQIVPLTRATIYRAIRAGRFPRPTKLLGVRASAWSESEIASWVAARLADRRPASRDASGG